MSTPWGQGVHRGESYDCASGEDEEAGDEVDLDAELGDDERDEGEGGAPLEQAFEDEGCGLV